MLTLVRPFQVEIYVRSLFTSVAVVACMPAAFGSVVGQECGFTINLPPSILAERDTTASEPVCAFQDSGETQNPFSNSITRVTWVGLKNLQVNNEPLTDIGFFRLSEKKIFVYQGRPSYSDERSGYRQRVTKRTSFLKQLTSGQMTKINHSEARVKWLKPVEGLIQEESTSSFNCLDAAKADSYGVVIFNWCLPKSLENRKILEQAISTLQIDLR
jgi:hypothetical protein